ncbi:MAG: PEP-CTERM sorting domain-containing protein [Terracidiphilus sp.]
MKKVVILLGAVLAFASCRANAVSYTYVGSWEVDQGPSFEVVPPAYTGQDAAALLFGGTPSDYVISTNGTDPTDINFEDWVSTWGSAPSCDGNFPCGTLSADDVVVTENGLYQNPGDTSSYVDDWAVGSQYTNYAFEVGGASPVPEPGTWLLMGTGLLGLALVTLRSKWATRRPTAGNLA